ncbi:cation diffusion facilitator family transporter [Jatrophihabitans sp. YIM 134969]
MWPTVVTLVLVVLEGVVLTAGALSTGSAVLVATAAQSFAGAGVEIFLLVGARSSRRPPSEAHPLGHGRESFFWSLIASLGVFVGGGVVALYYGVTALGKTETKDAYLLGYLLLGVIVVVDLGALWAAARPVNRSAAVGRHGFWHGLHRTSDAGGRTLVYDNAASVLGGLIGIGGLAVHQVTGDARADAVASLLIGLVLLGTTAFLLRANRALLTDQTISPDIVAAMRRRVCDRDGVVDVPELLAVYIGPQAVLVTGTVVLDAMMGLADVERALQDAADEIRARWPGETRVYLAPVASQPPAGYDDAGPPTTRSTPMPRPEQDPDEHDAQTDGDRPREEVVRDGNPGVPQSEYVVDDETPPPGPSAHDLPVGPGGDSGRAD